MPGTGVVYVVAVAVGQGRRAAAVAALGCTLGIVPHMAASILGLAALLRASPAAFAAAQALGVAYLLWMAWSVWRGCGGLVVDGRAGRTPSARLVRDGVLLNLLNPKLSVFFLAFLPQFVPADVPGAGLRMTGLALVFMALTLGAFLLYVAGAATLRDRVLARPRAMAWLRAGFAAAFAGLGLRLALASP